MTPAQIAERLSDRFRILTSSKRGGLPHHQTLQAAIDWSYDLLTDPERLLLLRLSTFSGGWSLEAAEKVCSDEKVSDWEVIDLLGKLESKSLVICKNDGNQNRYQMLESIRQYSLSKNTSDIEAADFGDVRHFEYFRDLAELAEPHLTGAEQATWCRVLDLEQDNIRQALSKAEARTDLGDALWVDGALRITSSIWRYWAVRGHLTEGRYRLEAALARGANAESKLKAKALVGAAIIAYRQGDYDESIRLHQEAITINEALGNDAAIGYSRTMIGVIRWEQGDHPAAKILLEQGLERSMSAGDLRGQGNALSNLGNVSAAMHNYDLAKAYYTRCLEIFRSIEDKQNVALALQNLGDLHNEMGEMHLAKQSLEEALEIAREIGDTRTTAYATLNLAPVYIANGDLTGAMSLVSDGIELCMRFDDRRFAAHGLESAALILHQTGHSGLATQVLGYVDILRDQISAAREGAQQVRFNALIVELGETLGNDFEAQWEYGCTLRFAEARRLALDSNPSNNAVSSLD